MKPIFPIFPILHIFYSFIISFLKGMGYNKFGEFDKFIIWR